MIDSGMIEMLWSRRVQAVAIVLIEEFDECNEEWHAIRTPLQVTEVSRVSVTEVSHTQHTLGKSGTQSAPRSQSIL